MGLVKRLADRSKKKHWAQVEHLLGSDEIPLDYVGTTFVIETLPLTPGWTYITNEAVIFFSHVHKRGFRIPFSNIRALLQNDDVGVGQHGSGPQTKVGFTSADGEHEVILLAFSDNPIGRRVQWLIIREAARAHPEWDTGGMDAERLAETNVPDLRHFR